MQSTKTKELMPSNQNNPDGLKWGGGNPPTLPETVQESAKFDPERIIVQNKFGIGNPFEADDRFQRHFWHEVVPIKDATEILSGREKLEDAPCTIGYKIELRYQPSTQYVRKILRRVGMSTDITARFYEGYKSDINGAIKKEIRRLSWRNLSNDNSAAEKRIASSIQSLMENKEIICSIVSCILEQPHIDWPKEDSTEKQIITDQNFYKEVEKDRHDYVMAMEQVREARLQEKEEKINKTHRRNEIDNLKTENADKEQLVTAQKEQLRLQSKLERDKKEIEWQAKHDQEIIRMNLEDSLRQNQMLYKDIEEKFLTYEADILSKEKHRSKVEEELKQVPKEVANHYEAEEIKLLSQRISAEKLLELQKQRFIKELFPMVLEKIQASQQPIEHLRVVQVNNGGDATAVPNNQVVQIAQAVTFIRELIGAFDDRKL